MKDRNHRLRRGLALATVVGALAAPTAWAAPIDPPIPGGGNEPTQQFKGPYAPKSSLTLPSPAEPSAVAGDSFDWGDAGIGAAAIVALAAIATGAALVATGHRPHRHTVS